WSWSPGAGGSVSGTLSQAFAQRGSFLAGCLQRLLFSLPAQQVQGPGQILSQASEAQPETQEADAQAAQQQDDDTEVPERALVVPEGEVQAVQAAVEPALDATVAVNEGE